MLKFVRLSAIPVAMLGLAAAANAAGIADMVGTWEWSGYTVQCKEGGANGISCLVTAGPKNVGMEMVQSKLEPKNGGYWGDIKHPASGEIYKTQLVLKDPNNWSLDGCTTGGVCASGVFTRVK